MPTHPTSSRSENANTRPCLFYFYLDSGMRRDALRGTLNCPGARYVLYGLDQLQAAGYTVQHNLDGETAPSRQDTRLAWLADRVIKMFGGSSGDFQTVLKERRRMRQADIVVSTVDNVGVPLVFLNFFGLLQPPLLYISIGLPERITAIKNPLTRAFYRLLYRRVTCFVTYGWEEAIWLRKWLGVPADSDRVVFVPFGVDPAAFQPLPTDIETIDVLSIGADMQRDFPLLLESAAHLPHLSFRIITSPHQATMLGPMPANVTLLTQVPFPEIRQHLAAARIVALPCRENTYSGGTTTLLQAMALAKAVVVSHTGAIRNGYQLENNVNCRLIEPGSGSQLDSAICELINDTPTRTRLGAAARHTIEATLSWSHYVNRMTTVIGSLSKPTT